MVTCLLTLMEGLFLLPLPNYVPAYYSMLVWLGQMSITSGTLKSRTLMLKLVRGLTTLLRARVRLRSPPPIFCLLRRDTFDAVR